MHRLTVIFVTLVTSLLSFLLMLFTGLYHLIHPEGVSIWQIISFIWLSISTLALSGYLFKIRTQWPYLFVVLTSGFYLVQCFIFCVVLIIP